MNTQSFERQLQQIDPPAPDAAARVLARQAALAEFKRLHAPERPRPAFLGGFWKGPWRSGFATACVAVVGVSIIWLMPEQERQIRIPAPLPAAVQVTAPPAPVTEAVTEAIVDAEQTQIASPPTPTPAPAPAPAAVARREAPAGDDAELAEVAVTGARIAAPSQVSGSNPIVTITGEEMRQLGVVNVADQITSLEPAPGSRTLTLVDGRRVVSTSNQADVVDSNAIPSNLLQRMDVVTGGASATYGSGAMAGIVANTLANADRELAEVQVTGTRATVAAAAPPAPPTALSLVTTAPPAAALRQQSGLVAPAPETARDRFERFETNPVKRATDEPVSTFSVDVDTTSYSFTRRMLNNGMLPPQDAVRAEEMINYFDYAWPAAQSRREPFRPTVTVSDSPWGEGRKLVHIGIKGYELPAGSKPDVNLVLLLDVSGSMNAPDRLPLVKQSMKLLLDSLKPTDTVAIAVYAGAAGQVLPPTPVRNRETIEQALDALRPGGSTAGARGIQLAYQMAESSFRKDGINRILLATDGDFNVGISNPDELQRLVERERGKGIYLSVLGFGQGNYRDDIAQKLAQNGNGVAAYIDTLSEARKVLVREATSSLFPIAGDVKIQVEFNPATVAEYRLVGYETRALNREDFNNDRIDAGEVGSGRAVTAIYEITPVGSGAQLVDERRYAAQEPRATAPRGLDNEYGFLRIRYKLPGAQDSQLLEQPIRVNAGVPRALRQDVAFSTAVAGFAQLLRGGRYTGSLSYDDVLQLAESSLGTDPHGYRVEFLDLVRNAKIADRAATSR